MKTLGQYYRELRLAQSLDMADVSRRCKLDRSTISNIERDRPIRWETVHAALTLGLGVHVDSEAYFRCHQYWLERRAEIATTQPEGHAEKRLSKHATEAVRKFRELIRDVSPVVAKDAFLAAKKAVDGTSRKG